MKRVPPPVTTLKPEQAQLIQQAVFQLVESQLDSRYFLVEVAFEKEAGYWYLRLYVDLKQGSISLSECESISRALDPVLETHPLLVDVAYNLEVSSPGLFRPLKSARELEFYQGEPVRVTGAAPTKNLKKAAKALPSELPTIAEGILLGFEAGESAKPSLLTLRDPSTQKEFQVSLQAEQAVYLNPIIRFPDDEEAEASSSESSTL